MKEKYIEERHPRWFNMTVEKNDISDTNRIAFAFARSETEAELIIKEHDVVLDALIHMAQEWDKLSPETFRTYWYEKCD
jgi:hypothetical protein